MNTQKNWYRKNKTLKLNWKKTKKNSLKIKIKKWLIKMETLLT